MAGQSAPEPVTTTSPQKLGPDAAIVRQHAPGSWMKTLGEEALTDLLKTGRPVPMVVLCADIRRSTSLMKESVDPRQFATELTGFVGDARRGIRQHYGWFDKFTGDGFLAYWICDSEPWSAHVPRVIGACLSLIDVLNTRIDRLRPYLQNLPSGVGLSCGIDMGPTSLAMVAGDLTILGPPVVGAVRMANAARSPGEILANVAFGSALLRADTKGAICKAIDIRRESRPTKEYDNQEVYAISGAPDWRNIFCDWADPNHAH